MCGFADQRDAVMRKLPRLLYRKRKQMTSGLDTDAAENRMRLYLCGIREFVIVQRHTPFGFVWGRDPHHGGAVAG